jgi:ribosomal protein L35
MGKVKKIKKKTRKFITKRVRVTKNGKGKVMKRTAGQGHFNARQTGKKKRNKRSDGTVSDADVRNIQEHI